MGCQRECTCITRGFGVWEGREAMSLVAQTQQGALLCAAGDYEFKFTLSLERMQEFFAASTGLLVDKVYDPGRPVAFSRTTYFDSADRKYLASSGTAHSRRLRVREYAAAAAEGAPVELTGLCYLELKTNIAGQRSKQRLAVSHEDMIEMLDTRRVHLTHRRSHHRADVIRALSEELADPTLRPLVTTWYRRRTLVDRDERVRVTIDTDLAFCPPTSFDRVPPEVVFSWADYCIVEVKYQEAPPWLGSILAELGEPQRLSKYALAMQALSSILH